MTKNPVFNGGIAIAYIIGIVFFIMNLGHILPEDNIVMPILALSLLTFSVAFMGFVFFFEPVKLLFAGERDAAGALFVKTLVSFGCFAALIIGIAFFAFPNLS